MAFIFEGRVNKLSINDKKNYNASFEVLTYFTLGRTKYYIAYDNNMSIDIFRSDIEDMGILNVGLFNFISAHSNDILQIEYENEKEATTAQKIVKKVTLVND